MGNSGHSSELIQDIGYRSANRQVLQTGSAPASTPTKVRQIDGSRGDDLIFHSLIVSGQGFRLRNPRAAFGSLMFQVLLVLALFIIPLFHVDPLPKKENVTAVHLQAPIPALARAAKVSAPKPTLTRAVASTTIPVPVHTRQEAPPPSVDTTSEMSDGIIGGSSDGQPTGTLATTHRVPVATKLPEPTPAKRVRVAAGVAQANLIHDVPPQYPPEAGRERIEGTVVLLAVIATDGTVKDVRVESGPPLLAQAAIDAVKQWRYKPYLLNGVPVEIDSRITVNFTMSRG